MSASAAARKGPSRLLSVLQRQRTLCARVVVSWTLAGGITAGGFLLAAMTWGEAKSAGMILPVTPVLFAMGAAAGFAHGSLLAYLGRPPDLLRAAAARTIGYSVVSLVFGIPVAAVLAGWIALGTATTNVPGLGPRAAALAAAVLGSLVLAWAVLEGLKALRNALDRWPQARLGTAILSVTLAFLVVLFHRIRPEIWFTDLRVTGLGAVVLAFAATLWIAAPVVIFLLGFLPAKVKERREG